MSEKNYGHRVTEHMLLWCDQCEASVEFHPGELARTASKRSVTAKKVILNR